MGPNRLVYTRAYLIALIVSRDVVVLQVEPNPTEPKFITPKSNRISKIIKPKNKWPGLIGDCAFKVLKLRIWGKLCFDEIESFPMDALGGFGGAGGFWGWNGFDQRRKKKKNSSGDRGKQRSSGSSDSVNVSKDAGYRFPLKQAVTAGALTFTGDTIAQISGRWNKKRAALKQSASDKLDEVRLKIFSSVSVIFRVIKI